LNCRNQMAHVCLFVYVDRLDVVPRPSNRWRKVATPCFISISLPPAVENTVCILDVCVGADDRADKCTLWCKSKEKVTSAVFKLLFFLMTLILKSAASKPARNLWPTDSWWWGAFTVVHWWVLLLFYSCLERNTINKYHLRWLSYPHL